MGTQITWSDYKQLITLSAPKLSLIQIEPIAKISPQSILTTIVKDIMKKLISVTVVIFAFSSLAQAEGQDDLRSQHPDARNDRQVAEMHDKARVSHASRHLAKHQRAARQKHRDDR
jgi:hypothetical protein